MSYEFLISKEVFSDEEQTHEMKKNHKLKNNKDSLRSVWEI